VAIPVAKAAAAGMAFDGRAVLERAPRHQLGVIVKHFTFENCEET
jgi:hypothetical protein